MALPSLSKSNTKSSPFTNQKSSSGSSTPSSNVRITPSGPQSYSADPFVRSGTIPSNQSPYGGGSSGGSGRGGSGGNGGGGGGSSGVVVITPSGLQSRSALPTIGGVTPTRNIAQQLSTQKTSSQKYQGEKQRSYYVPTPRGEIRKARPSSVSAYTGTTENVNKPFSFGGLISDFTLRNTLSYFPQRNKAKEIDYGSSFIPSGTVSPFETSGMKHITYGEQQKNIELTRGFEVFKTQTSAEKNLKLYASQLQGGIDTGSIPYESAKSMFDVKYQEVNTKYQTDLSQISSKYKDIPGVGFRQEGAGATLFKGALATSGVGSVALAGYETANAPYKPVKDIYSLPRYLDVDVPTSAKIYASLPLASGYGLVRGVNKEINALNVAEGTQAVKSMVLEGPRIKLGEGLNLDLASAKAFSGDKTVMVTRMEAQLSKSVGSDYVASSGVSALEVRGTDYLSGKPFISTVIRETKAPSYLLPQSAEGITPAISRVSTRSIFESFVKGTGPKSNLGLKGNFNFYFGKKFTPEKLSASVGKEFQGYAYGKGGKIIKAQENYMQLFNQKDLGSLGSLGKVPQSMKISFRTDTASKLKIVQPKDVFRTETPSKLFFGSTKDQSAFFKGEAGGFQRTSLAQTFKMESPSILGNVGKISNAGLSRSTTKLLKSGGVTQPSFKMASSLKLAGPTAAASSYYGTGLYERTAGGMSPGKGFSMTGMSTSEADSKKMFSGSSLSLPSLSQRETGILTSGLVLPSSQTSKQFTTTYLENPSASKSKDIQSFISSLALKSEQLQSPKLRSPSLRSPKLRSPSLSYPTGPNPFRGLDGGSLAPPPFFGLPSLGGFGQPKGQSYGFKFKTSLAPSFTAQALNLKGMFPKETRIGGMNLGILPTNLRYLPGGRASRKVKRKNPTRIRRPSRKKKR